VTKTFISANQLLSDSYQLALKVLEDNYHPTFLLAIWRGGTPIGIAMHELLKLSGLALDHIAIRTAHYAGLDQRNKKVVVNGLDYVIKHLQKNDKLLIVDDVHDSGQSILAVIQEISEQLGDNTPNDIRLATIYYKPSRSEVAQQPDYYLHETEDWLVFPHELEGLSAEEIQAKPGIESIRNVLAKKIIP